MARLIRTTIAEVLVGTTVYPSGTVLSVADERAASLVAQSAAVYLDEVANNGIDDAEGDATFGDSIPLSADTPVTLDLTDLSGQTGEAGDTAFATVTALLIRNNSATDPLLVGGAASTIFEPFSGATGDKVVVPPGQEFLWFSSTEGGDTTTDHKSLKLDPGSAAFSADVAVRGFAPEA